MSRFIGRSSLLFFQIAKLLYSDNQKLTHIALEMCNFTYVTPFVFLTFDFNVFFFILIFIFLIFLVFWIEKNPKSLFMVPLAHVSEEYRQLSKNYWASFEHFSSYLSNFNLIKEFFTEFDSYRGKNYTRIMEINESTSLNYISLVHFINI